MKKTKRLLCMLISVLMVALMVAGCGTEKVENKVLTILPLAEKYKKVPLKGIYTGELKDGKPEGNGVFKYSDKNGKKVTYTGGFKNGKYHGEYIKEFEDGDRSEGIYKDGNEVKWKIFTNGKPKIEKEVKDEKAVMRFYYDNGKLAGESVIKDGKIIGSTEYYESGKIKFKGNPDGEGTEYNENGSIKYKGKFVKGKPAN